MEHGLNDESKIEHASVGVDERRRKALVRLIRGGAFAAPVVASFAMSGLVISSAQAATANSSTFTPPPPPG